MALYVVGPAQPVYVVEADATVRRVVGPALPVYSPFANLTPGPLNTVQFNILYAGPEAHSEGLVYWDDEAHTFSVMTDVEDVILQVGQEQHVRVYNNSGAQIDNGDVVYVTGAAGGGLPTIALARADSITTAVVLGVATADIANGAIGIVTTFGIVRDIDTSAFAAGATVYLSATIAGALDDTIPDSPNLVVGIGCVLISDINIGRILVGIDQANVVSGVVQSKIYTLPLRGVVGTDLNITGEFRTVTSNEAGDYATDFAVGNNHVFLLINSITGAGDVTITGTSIDENDGTPSVGDTEIVSVDGTPAQYYQSAKKWWEVTNIDIPPGITVIDYDIGVVGYSDFGNTNFKVTGYRLDTTSQGVNSEIRFRIIKIDDDGDKKMSLTDLEDITIDSGVVGSQIIDNIRVGGDDRSFDPDVADIWPNGSVAVLKQGDFDEYFSSDENIFESRTKDEGFILRIEQSNNVDFITLRLDYQIIPG